MLCKNLFQGLQNEFIYLLPHDLYWSLNVKHLYFFQRFLKLKITPSDRQKIVQENGELVELVLAHNHSNNFAKPSKTTTGRILLSYSILLIIMQGLPENDLF